MKMKTRLFFLLGAAALGAAGYKYVKDHREELDRFLAEYGDVMENEYLEEDLIEPPIL